MKRSRRLAAVAAVEIAAVAAVAAAVDMAAVVAVDTAARAGNIRHLYKDAPASGSGHSCEQTEVF